MFAHYSEQAKLSSSKTLNGTDVWRLYDTFGFPVDLTRIMAEESGLEIDEEEFEKAKAESKEASKGRKKAGEAELLKLDVHDLGKLELMKDVPKTDDRYKYGKYRHPTIYMGPDANVSQGEVTSLVRSRPSTTTRPSSRALKISPPTLRSA